MTKPTPKKTAFDNEFDNESWSQREISISSKVLIALGGITSFGGMIPLIITKISNVNEDFTVTPWFFVVFTLFYFVGPLLVLYFWNSLSNRVFKPEQKPSNWKEFKSSPVTYRYGWLILIHIFFVAIYLIISIINEHVYVILFSAILLSVSALIAVRSYSNRVYKSRKIKPLYVHVAFGLLLCGFVGVGYFFYNDISEFENENHQLKNNDYEKIADVEEISARLVHIENDLTNEADRFFILSGMNAWNILSQEMTYFEDSVDLSAFKIDATISSLNNFLIADKVEASALPNAQLNAKNDANKKEVLALKPFVIKHNNSCRKHKAVLIKNEQGANSANEKSIGNQLFINNETHTAIIEKIRGVDDSINKSIGFKMGVVNWNIDTMLNENRHRLYPECFEEITATSKHLKAGKSEMDDSTMIQVSKLSPAVRTKLAATMNRYNSRIFKDWLEQMYLPYAQRKSAREIEVIAQETAWIWKEIKYIGIFISLATLFLLALNYLELLDLKAYLIESNLNSEENNQTLKERIGDLNQKSSYLLFPLTTSITIVAILLIPVTTKTEIANIEPTKSFRMLQVPSLKLPKAVESAVNIEENERSEAINMVQEINRLSNEINELTQALHGLSNNKGDKSEGQSMNDEASELKNSIAKLSEQLKLMQSELESIQNEIEKSKRR